MRNVRSWLPALLSAVAALVVWLQIAGANGPLEWRWEYHPLGLDPWCTAAAIALAGVVAWGASRANGIGVAIAIAGGALLSLALLAAQQGGLRRVSASLISPQVFGYLFDAGVAPPNGELLADYPAASPRLSMHARTHPPGPLLAIRGLDAMISALPLPETQDGGQVAAARAAWDTEFRRARDHGRAVPRSAPSPWTVVTLAWLLPALSALVAWPLYGLARELGLEAESAAFAAALWLLVPARTLFTPSLDQAVPLLLVLACWWALRGPVRVGFAGALLWLCIFLSYGFLPWVPLVVALVFWNPQRESTRWKRIAALATGFLLPALGLWLATGYDALASLRAALEEHRLMAVATRSYARWLFWNPYDFALLLGPGVLLAALFVARPAPLTAKLRVLTVALAALFLLLWLGGSVRGEVGRIWLFFMPFACLLGAATLGGVARRALLAAQLVLLLALAASMIFVS
ncbi:MAG: hypothetical protein ABI609_00885 [Acidobacteriota bacterium]